MKKRATVLWLAIAGFLVLTIGAQAQWGDLKKMAEKAKNSNTKKKDTNKKTGSDTSSSSDTNSGDKKAEDSQPADSTDTKKEDSKSESSPATKSNTQPQMHDVKIDFVPGEKTIMFDDFSDWGEDEPPPHWKVRGDAVTMRVDGPNHELLVPKSSQLTSPNFDVPENFTFEVTIAPNPTYQGHLNYRFLNAKGNGVAQLDIDIGGDSIETYASVGESLGSPRTKADLKQPIKVAYWVQNGRLRAYVNGTRALDVNDVHPKEPIRSIHIDASGPIAMQSIRIAESAPDFSTVMAATGKYVTHGIYFDTDSDVLKPESAPVLKMIANGLTKNPALKLQVAGYTDSVGNDAHNLDLSKRRAQAVVTVLSSQFGIDGARLTANGYGAASPIASNDTADGRAQNRRVEFVKQ